MWRIQSVAEPELYWSNHLGWVDLPSATVFSETERIQYLEPFEGRWTDLEVEELPEAVVLQVIQAIIPSAVFTADDDGFLTIQTSLMYTGWHGENLIGEILMPKEER
jgi:hypothetical protein